MLFEEFTEGLRNPADNPCWKGYYPVGTKKKSGRTVPNCVPRNEGAGDDTLQVGDPVIITGDVEYWGKTGDVREVGQDGSFVVVDLYNYGPYSFHASDVSYNDYADSEDELNEFALDDDSDDPTEDYPCYDCGSTIFLHHTKLCDFAEPNAKRDLPAQPGTQYWTGQIPKGLAPIPGLAEGVNESEDQESMRERLAALQRDLKAVTGSYPGDDRNRGLIRSEIFRVKQELKAARGKKPGVTETNVAKYADMGATNSTTHFIKNMTTGKIVSPHRSLQDAQNALVGNERGSNDKFKIVRARKSSVAEGSSFPGPLSNRDVATIGQLQRSTRGRGSEVTAPHQRSDWFDADSPVSAKKQKLAYLKAKKQGVAEGSTDDDEAPYHTRILNPQTLEVIADDGPYDWENDAVDRAEVYLAQARRQGQSIVAQVYQPAYGKNYVTWQVPDQGDYNLEEQGVAEQEKVGNMPADKFDDAMARLKQLAGAGPLKTVWDPQKRVYRNMPTAVQPKK